MSNTRGIIAVFIVFCVAYSIKRAHASDVLDIETSDVNRNERMKRSGVGSGYAIWRTILQGAKKRRPSLRMNHIRYSKPGTYDDALRDFRSVQPKNVQYVDEPSLTGAVGTFGDRTIVLKRQTVNGMPQSPMLYVYKTAERDFPDSQIDILTYN